MRRKSKQLLALLMTLVMCFATLAPAMVVFAEEPSRTIIAQELFESGSINTDPGEDPVVAADGFWFGSGKSTYTLEGGTLKYTDRHSSDLTDIRFYYDGQEADRELLKDDFTLSFRLKPLINSLDMWINWTQHDYASVSYEDGLRLSAGVLSGRGITDRTIARVPMDQWSVIEVYFEYDETAEAFYKQNGTVYKTGETGAFTSYTVRLNGMDVGTAALGTANEIKNAFHCIDFIRLFQGATGNYELDDLTVITGAAPYSTNWDQSQADYNNIPVFYTNKTPATNYAYSMAVVGDTQIVCFNDVKYGQNGMDTIYQWIVDNKESKNIQYVLGVGDVTQSQNNAAEFELAKNAIYKMNGVVPYSLVRGNHDNSPEYNNTFNNADYTSQFEGFYNDKIENSYRRMTIGDTKYLFITLDYGPEDEVLDWAGELCATYPDHKVIITTHAYLYADGTTIDTDDVCDPITMNGRENNGETIWNKLGRKYENIFMIISGHISSDRVQVVEAEGDNGNIVTQMLVDFQSVDSDYGYGSVGVVTMLYFSEDGKQVEVEAYSPIKQAYFREDNQFTFDIEKKTIVYHDFEGVEMGHANNGYGSFATVANNGGLGITDSANVSVVDGKMVCNFVNGNLVDLQLYNCGYADTGSSPINKDFVLSFDVQIGSTSASYGSIAIRDNIENKWLSPISLNSGKIHLNGVGSAELSTSELTHVEIVFNYDATATNSDSTTGAFTSVTLIVGGKQIGTAALNRTNGNFKYINHFRMFQDNNGTASLTLDNIYVGYGKGNRGAEFGTELYNVDFVGMTIPNEDSHQGTGFKLMNSFDTAKGVTDSKTNITYKGASYIANDIVSVRGSVTGDARGFIDLNLNDIGKKLSSGDAVLSMKIRPYGDMSSKVLTRVDGTDDTHFDIQYVDGTNYIKVDGQSYTTGVALSSYRFSTVEIVLHYDYAKLQYTKVSLYVNGEYIGSDDLKPVSQITLFRLFDSWSWNNNRGVDVDEVTIVTGNRTAYEGETVKTEFIGYQTTTPTNDAFNLRLISIMTDSDLSKYASIGYDVSVTYTYDGTNTETETLPASIGQCNKVFTSVVETTEMAGLNEITAAELGGQYIFAINVLGISTAWTNVQFTVTTYYQLTGQEKTTERTFNFTVDAANSI